MQPPSEPSQRNAAVFGAYLALAAAAALFVLLTVNRRGAGELQHDLFAQRTHWVVTFWQTHGYFASGGLVAFPAVMAGRKIDAPFYFYRSGSGAWYLPALLVESVARGYNWRLAAVTNLLIAAPTAALLALLCYRLARRIGALPLHAFTLGACVLAVHFTFPDVLSLYWEMSAQALALPFFIAFLLLYESERKPRIAQAIVVFAMVYVDWMTAAFFLASFIAACTLLRRAAWREWTKSIAIPAAAALLVFAMQLLIVHIRYPQVPLIGSSFKSRTGLDGDTTYYHDHADIALGRDVARANFAHNRPQLFRWPTLFVAGLASLVALLLLFLRNRLPPTTFVALATMTGTYALYAGIFSQATVIHPYLFDVLLATPLMLALFGLVPAAGEALTESSGAITLVTLFAAIWYAMVQLRDYALRYPMM